MSVGSPAPPLDRERSESPGPDQWEATDTLAVSVVVPTFRRDETLLRLLAALAEQDLPRDRFEVVVVDDACSQSMPAAVAGFAAHEPGLRLRLLPGKSQGPATARNIGWRAATAPLIAFIDDDAYPERLDSIGDVLMSTPAMRALKQPLPGRQIALLTSPSGAEAGRLCPVVDEVIAYDALWMKATAPRESAAPDLAMVERLRAGRFDGAAIFTCFSQSPLPAALFCFLAGIPLRLAHCRENPYQLLSDRLPECEPGSGIRHEVQRQSDLVAAIGCRTDDDRLALGVPAAAQAAIDGRLAGLRVDGGRPWAVLHTGATAASRRYPPEQFAAAARCLVERHGWRLLYTGDAGERELVERVVAASGVPGENLAGRLSFAELAALIARAPLVITNNSGPAHVAAALGTPVVDLYAGTNPQHTPRRVPARVLMHDVPCRWCFKSVCPEGHQLCLRGIAPGEVVQAALELMRETRQLA